MAIAADTSTLPSIPTLALDPMTIEQLADAVAARLADRLPKPDPPMSDDTVLDSREAADYLRLPSINALHKLTARGEIVCESRTRPRARLRFRKRDLDDWLSGAS